jgi:hypothetical protein
MASTTNLIRLQSDVKDHVKGEYEFRNIRNGTRIISKEMADYSAMKSYLEGNNLHYFTFSLNSEKPIKVVVIHHYDRKGSVAKEISSLLSRRLAPRRTDWR